MMRICLINVLLPLSPVPSSNNLSSRRCCCFCFRINLVIALGEQGSASGRLFFTRKVPKKVLNIFSEFFKNQKYFLNSKKRRRQFAEPCLSTARRFLSSSEMQQFHESKSAILLRFSHASRQVAQTSRKDTLDSSALKVDLNKLLFYVKLKYS